MQALHFILNTLLGLYQVVLLLRLLMQLTRADFRNPLARAILQLTDPVILPMRRVLPPLGKLDSASVLAVLLMALLKVWVLHLLLFGLATPGLPTLLRGVTLDVVELVLKTYLFSIVLNAILSFVVQGTYSPAQSLLASICEPVLKPIRKHIPSLAGLDLSPLWACIAIQALLLILP
jgi:YggT family protein